MYTNERFPEMWKIILEEVDFNNAIVIDAGCGYGDFTIAASQAGAKKVYAIDYDERLTKRLAKKTKQYDNIVVARDDINGWNDEWYPKLGENISPANPCKKILSCFSVLPYLDNPDEALKIFAKMADVVLVECQYFEDGPGFDFLMINDDMELWLRHYWQSVKCIGKTHVVDRQKYRYIWMCQ